MVSVKWCNGARATSHGCGGWVRKPNPHVVNLNRGRSRIGGRVVPEHVRRRSNTGCLNEGLFAENTGEITNSPSIPICADVALIPGQSERAMRNLKEENCEVSASRQVRGL